MLLLYTTNFGKLYFHFHLVKNKLEFKSSLAYTLLRIVLFNLQAFQDFSAIFCWFPVWFHCELIACIVWGLFFFLFVKVHSGTQHAVYLSECSVWKKRKHFIILSGELVYKINYIILIDGAIHFGCVLSKFLPITERRMLMSPTVIVSSISPFSFRKKNFFQKFWKNF